MLVILFLLQLAQPVLSARQVDIILTLYERNITLAEGSDDDRRELTTKIIQQFVCEFPNDGFTSKSASSTRPFSKDSIAKHDNGRLYSWDWQNGTTRKPQVRVGMLPSFDITGQNPIPLTCVNHLAVIPTEPTTTEPMTDYGPVIMKRLDELALQLKQHDESPTYWKKVFGNRYVQTILSAVAGWAATR